ncbi:hypothetical protein BJV77DRAFT_966587 [Russula vinacea]|nr:hypothetical protein BJV77DRAFT_966587 [Russula vinacea]
MMFLKAVFTLYFAAVTLAAPGLVELSDVAVTRFLVQTKQVSSDLGWDSAGQSKRACQACQAAVAAAAQRASCLITHEGSRRKTLVDAPLGLPFAWALKADLHESCTSSCAVACVSESHIKSGVGDLWATPAVAQGFIRHWNDEYGAYGGVAAWRHRVISVVLSGGSSVCLCVVALPGTGCRFGVTGLGGRLTGLKGLIAGPGHYLTRGA